MDFNFLNGWMTLSLPAVVLPAVIVLPFVAACGFSVRCLRPGLRFLAPWTAVPAVLLSCWGNAQAYPASGISSLFLNARLGMDEIGRVFLLFTAVVWLLAGIYAVFYIKEGKDTCRFFVSYLLAMGGNLGLVLAQDVISFYCFFAVMSFASYSLVVHAGDATARKAGRVYITLVVLGEVIVFSALVLTAYAAGGIYFSELPAKIAASPHRDFITVLVLLGFGVKAGALPMHVWLPLAHPAAPVPASAVLSGAMIKAGLLGWLRILPLGEMTSVGWGLTIMLAGGLAALYGAFVGITQHQAKTVLAYSSISQMGMMTMAVGAGFLSSAAWSVCQSAILLYATHHAFAKAALFLGVGVTGRLSAGVWRKVGVAAGMVLPALAIAGAPLTSGAVAKGVLKYSIKKAAQGLFAEYGIPWLLTAAAVGTVLLIMRFLQVVRRDAQTGTERGQSSVGMGMTASWFVLTSCSVLLPGGIFLFQWGGEAARRALVEGQAVLPLFAGVVLFFSALKTGWRLPVVPAGDVLVMYYRAMDAGWVVSQAMREIIISVMTVKRSLAVCARKAWPGFFASYSFWKPIDKSDAFFCSWMVFGSLAMIFAVCFFLSL